jgi:hypothetical protein
MRTRLRVRSGRLPRLLAVTAVTLATLCIARPAPADAPLPAELRGWDSWVLEGHETHRCPWLAPGQPRDVDRVCAWPAVLELQVDGHGGRFSQRWQIDTESWLPLPGSPESWPQNVTLDGKPAALVAQGVTPSLRVGAGVHLVSGTFSWARRPQMLSVPASVALVSLAVDGAHVAVQRNGEGVLLGAPPVARQDNSLDVRVFRMLEDDLPSMLFTRVHLAVAGEAREIQLPQLLPTGFVPTAVDGELAARLDPDNTLRVQVRPGEFDLTLAARGPSPLAEVRLGERPAPWPKSEVWSFQAQDRLRVVAIEGVPPTDPAQVNVPQEWRELPAYRMEAASVLRVSERSRGLAATDANQLRLARTAWLDFSGAGYTIVDNLSGQMRQGWRLEMMPPYALQSAHTDSGNWFLVTSGLGSGSSGIEVRSQQLDLTAVSRLPRTGGALPASGWRERFAQASGRLIVAPGYRLLAAFGPDSAPQAWVERWRLLDIFAVLLIATVAWRVLGLRIAALAIAAMTLTHQEPSSPTWLWLNVLIALALLRAAPEGRLRRWAGAYRLIALALLLFVLVPFALTQVRLAVYPQLEALAAPAEGVHILTATHREAPPAPAAQMYSAPLNRPTEAGLMGKSAAALGGNRNARNEVVAVTAARRTASQEYEPDVLVQAGPGLPQWHYHVYDYGWSGPVEASATVRFLISPPWLTRLWRLLGVAFSGLLLFVIARNDLKALPGRLRRAAPAGAAAAIVLMGLGIGAALTARAASTPDPQLLTELQTRLLAAPKCAPDCAGILAAQVSVSAKRLDIVLDVGALDTLGIALPGADPNWAPDTVQVDGAAAGWIYRNGRGIRYASVAPGRHVIRMAGSLAHVEGLSLAFPFVPQQVEVSAPGWEVSGINARRLISGALQLVRHQATQAQAGGALRQEEFPAFVSVGRLFHLRHDWTIETGIERIAPKSSAFTLKLPLLPRESVTTSGLESGEGGVTVGLASAEARTHFSSIIPVSESLELVAANAATYTEHWSFDVGSTWHVDFSGTPAVAPAEDSGSWLFEYYPRPGEHLKLTVARPQAAPGGTLAFDHVDLLTRVGKRSSSSVLQLNYRSTQGGRQVLHLPPAAEVTALKSDNESLALRPENGELSLSALPGQHTFTIDWQVPAGAAFVVRSAPVDLGAPGSNLGIHLGLPQDRWVLYVFGRGVGPTILYWGELIAFIALAWAIGRSRLTSLPTRDWLLLGLGLSTFSWLVFGFFVAFVAMFEWRARVAAPAEPRRFNLLQVALGVLGVAAVLAVVAAVPKGLLAHPDMRVMGAGFYGQLNWFVDQTHSQLPRSGVVSVSLWWYKLAMLAWALWLSFALTRWIRWAWQVYSREGLWRRVPPRARTPASPGPVPPA